MGKYARKSSLFSKLESITRLRTELTRPAEPEVYVRVNIEDNILIKSLVN